MIRIEIYAFNGCTSLNGTLTFLSFVEIFEHAFQYTSFSKVVSLTKHLPKCDKISIGLPANLTVSVPYDYYGIDFCSYKVEYRPKEKYKIKLTITSIDILTIDCLLAITGIVCIVILISQKFKKMNNNKIDEQLFENDFSNTDQSMPSNRVENSVNQNEFLAFVKFN